VSPIELRDPWKTICVKYIALHLDADLDEVRASIARAAYIRSSHC